MKVMFFSNGNTMAFDENKQQLPHLQESWLLLYIQFLIGRGIEPAEVEFIMPGGRRARAFKLDDGSYNWRFD